jgi:prolycopene isomerase
MELTEDTILRDHYDVIVVGAGLGGMTAASLLARRGLSVLMIEQQGKPGGACTSFKREDHVQDVGAAMLYGFGEKGFRPFHFLLNELEAPIDIIPHATLARMSFEGQEIVFWPDLQRFIDELAELIPDEKEGLKAFYSDLYKMYENIVIKNEVIVPPSEFSPRQGLRRLFSDPFSIIKMQRLLSTSTMDLLKKYFHSPKLFNFFDKLCSAYAYTTAEETPAVLAATMFIDNHIGGVYYPAGGAQMLPNAIEKAFERDGGQAIYHQLVEEILIKNGQAYGVRLKNGTEILASRVIANATVWNIYGRLVRPESIKPERLKWAQSLIPTFPSMTLYMVVYRNAIPEIYNPWEIFIENRKVIDSSDLTLYINSLVDSSLCPSGELIVMAIAPNFCAWPHPNEPAYHSIDYETQKQQEAKRMIDQIEQHLPGFRSHIRSVIIGTPTTIERYLLKNGGAVGGPKNKIGQEMLKRLHARSEWKNLYFCGDSTVMGTGAPAAVVSGVGAVNIILRELHKPEYDTHPFPRQYVHFVEPPYQRPNYPPGTPVSIENAFLAAAKCQGCQDPQCVKDCPAGIDIPGFLRRMEAKNYTGAARLIREKNPFGETCGLACAADTLCQQRCYRRDFTGKPVNIAELQQWVCVEAGRDGWLKNDLTQFCYGIAVIGGGVSAMSCAYYLTLAGRQVSVFASENQLGGRLLDKSATNKSLQAAFTRDIEGILASGVTFNGNQKNFQATDLTRMLKQYACVFITKDQLTDLNGSDTLSFLADLRLNYPGLFLGEEFPMNGLSVVEAAAFGRRVALSICQYLNISS